MSYEPRNRGMRSRRIATKKPASKEKRGSQETTFFYEEAVPVNPKEISSRITNALEHLGKQRFALPPFYEHFQRWMKDVESVLGDFKNALPEAANGEYNSTVAGLLSNVRNEFDKRIESEKTLSTQVTELQRQFSMHELEMSELEKEQRNKVHEAKRGYEKSMKKLRGEIGALDEQRLKLIRKSPTVLERIFGRSKARIDGSSHALQSKRNDLQGREENLKRRLDGLRSDYEEKRKQLNVRETKLTEKLEKLKIGTLDDALEIRRSVCEQLRQAVAASVNRFTAQSKENPQ